jgi:hypothetical protein
MHPDRAVESFECNFAEIVERQALADAQLGTLAVLVGLRHAKIRASCTVEPKRSW